ncbi:hypothetical protein ACZ90_04780 [Streptomyces albus subsp. albus]|nr:hypothetical protein ACZ90_04780 [Streptomyces albus subsp. albus]
MELDLRKLRYFVAVAERLHFSRAAEALRVAQPLLSRQIQSLEERLGTRLFHRNRHTTELTAAGEQLLEEARALLAAAEAAQRRVARAADGRRHLAIGCPPGSAMAQAADALRALHPELVVHEVGIGWADQSAAVLDGRVDIGCLRRPFDDHGMRTRPLLTESRVAVLPEGHPLTGKETVGLADLTEERLLQDPAQVPGWPGPDHPGAARPGPDGPPPRSVEEEFAQVAAGQGIVIQPRSVARWYARPGLGLVPVDGVAPAEVHLAWQSGRRNPLIEEFADLAARPLPGT